MEGPPLGPVGEDITWPDQVAPRGRKASSTRKIKPQTSNLKPEFPDALAGDIPRPRPPGRADHRDRGRTPAVTMRLEGPTDIAATPPGYQSRTPEGHH